MNNMVPNFPQGRLDRVIVWFRRDLRVADNPALMAALQMAKEVIPVYIYCPEEEGQFQPGRCSRWWLHCALASLKSDLAALGSDLILHRAQESRSALAELVQQTGAQGMVFNHLYDPISMVRDNEVKLAMATLGVFCCSFNGDLLREPWEILDPSSGKPYTCYDSFWGAHQSLPYPPANPVPAPPAMPPVAKTTIQGLELQDLGIMTPEEELSNVQLEYHWTPGSKGAHKTFVEFIEGRLRQFDRDRAKTDRNSTSRLSPHIHFGEISVRHIYNECIKKAEQWHMKGDGNSSVVDFLRQLGYREYSRYLSFHFPFTHERSLLEHLRGVPWRFDQTLFKAWRQGRTGYPLVDAGMREVWSTGWMHNRIRVVVATFMVKNLMLPWQWGLKHFWDALLDADLECDALGWQYCAGCLSDAHPFDELMDITSESARFDPDGNYVRRWLPMLARLPLKYIHKPWEAPPQVLEDAGVELGVNYPLPIVSFEESQTVLAAAAAAVGIGSQTKSALAGPFMPATDIKSTSAAKFWSLHNRNLATSAPAGCATPGTHREGAGGTDDGAAPSGVVCVSAPTWRSSLKVSDGSNEEVQSNAIGLDNPSALYVMPSTATAMRSAAVSDCRQHHTVEVVQEQETSSSLEAAHAHGQGGMQDVVMEVDEVPARVPNVVVNGNTGKVVGSGSAGDPMVSGDYATTNGGSGNATQTNQTMHVVPTISGGTGNVWTVPDAGASGYGSRGGGTSNQPGAVHALYHQQQQQQQQMFVVALPSAEGCVHVAGGAETQGTTAGGSSGDDQEWPRKRLRHDGNNNAQQ